MVKRVDAEVKRVDAETRGEVRGIEIPDDDGNPISNFLYGPEENEASVTAARLSEVTKEEVAPAPAEVTPPPVEKPVATVPVHVVQQAVEELRGLVKVLDGGKGNAHLTWCDVALNGIRDRIKSYEKSQVKS